MINEVIFRIDVGHEQSFSSESTIVCVVCFIRMGHFYRFIQILFSLTTGCFSCISVRHECFVAKRKKKKEKCKRDKLLPHALKTNVSL